MVKYTGRRGSQMTKNSTNQLGLKWLGVGIRFAFWKCGTTRPERYCEGFDYQKLPIPEKASNGIGLRKMTIRECVY